MSRPHVIYLAIIAVLILVVVYASATAVRANKLKLEVEARFGLNEHVRSSWPRKNDSQLRPGIQAADILRPRTYAERQREVDELVERALKLEEFGPTTNLSKACGDALVGGKRLRAVIVLEVARATSLANPKLTPVDVGEAALFIEYVHTASLVIDDLPAFDNDELRRGRPSLHAAVGPAVAQMAALSLISGAFQNLCRQIDWIRDNCPEIKNVDRIGTRICNDVSRALGAMGAAGGQYMDVSNATDLLREHGPDAVIELMYRKTATFFEIAIITGWLAAGGGSEQTPTMREIGRSVGTAFQIADDIGDMASDAARAATGKPGWNFANEYGIEVATREMNRHLKGARLLLNQSALWTPLWEEIYAKVRGMTVAPEEPAPEELAPEEPAPEEPAPEEPAQVEPAQVCSAPLPGAD